MNRVMSLVLTALIVSSFSVAAYAGWMSYAVDGRGALGHGLSPNRTAAQNFALSYCGNTQCKVIETIASKCVGFAESHYNGYWYGIGAGPTLAAAQGYAINWCAKSAPASTCRLRHSYCQ